MKKFVRILSVVLSAGLLLAGCSGNTEISSVGGSANSAVTSADGSSAVSEPVSAPSSTPEETSSQPDAPASKYDDLLEEMGGFGREVTAYGDLTGESYSAALSELEAVLDAHDREIALVAYSLDNNKAVGYNTEAELFPASAIKAAYTFYCCLLMEQGNGSLDDTMAYEPRHYEPGTGDMQRSPYGTVFDMRTILTKTMTISDNVGYLMMVEHFGREGYNEWIAALGCPSLQIKPTVWSLRTKAEEFAVLWREIARYFETGSDYAQFFYGICTNTAGSFATAALSEVDYSHKQGHNRSGDWLSYSDAGIVWGDEPYIIVILTHNPGITAAGEQVMADAIKIIDELF